MPSLRTGGLLQTPVLMSYNSNLPPVPPVLDHCTGGTGSKTWSV